MNSSTIVISYVGSFGMTPYAEIWDAGLGAWDSHYPRQELTIPGKISMLILRCYALPSSRMDQKCVQNTPRVDSAPKKLQISDSGAQLG